MWKKLSDSELTMDEWRLVYKCRMCGEEIKTIPRGRYEEACNLNLLDGEALFYIVHYHLSDESRGIADLVGFKKVK